MATENVKDTHRIRRGRRGRMSHDGLRPRPGSMAELDPGSGGVASLNHRLQAVIPPGWMDDAAGDGRGPGDGLRRVRARGRVRFGRLTDRNRGGITIHPGGHRRLCVPWGICG